MAKTNKRTLKRPKQEQDSTYFLKLVLYIVLGAFWIRLPQPYYGFNAIPVGFFIGLIFASHDHFAIDRKIEYAVLIVVALFTYLAAGAILP